MARKRFHDRKSAGRSRLVPYRPGEHHSDRHDRRLTHALDNKHKVERWCTAHGIGLAITNRGHHWVFARGETLVEWWPSSAKLVVSKDYKNGIHTHDYQQVIEQLGKSFKEVA